MKLIINKEDENRIEFWITRRLYLSTLFQLDTYLENMNIQPPKEKSEKKQKQPEKQEAEVSAPSTACHLLNNITFKLGKKKLRVWISFFARELECETVLSVEDFLDFYIMMRNTFPKKEWGII
jgi:hypothetical protein